MEVFADTLYWIATARPNDSWAAAARRAKTNLGPVQLVTTEEVLSEVLTALAGGGPNLRGAAAAMVRAIQTSPDVRVISQSGESFLAGLAYYESRLDKSYSMVDCVSMQVMRSHQIEAVLTNDHHFTQDGFVALIAKD